jgi:hypothetical protein
VILRGSASWLTPVREINRAAIGADANPNFAPAMADSLWGVHPTLELWKPPQLMP